MLLEAHYLFYSVCLAYYLVRTDRGQSQTLSNNRDTYFHSCITHKNIFKQAGAELCQAQLRLEAWWVGGLKRY